MKSSVNYSRSPILSDRQGFNRRWFADGLQNVFVATDGPSLESSINSAINAYGSAFSVSSGRHCYENFVYRPGVGAIVDCSAMKGVGYDPNRGYYVDAGNNNWSMYTALLNQYNLTIPAGSCYSVGVGGHICGGGYGLLSRMYGLSVDWLTGVDIVVKPSANSPAKLINVSKYSAGPEGNLFWACKGGGGNNFGTIARYYFETLPTAPSEALQVTWTWDWSDVKSSDDLASLIAFFEQYALPQDPSSWPYFFILKLTHQSNGTLGMVIQVALDSPNKDVLGGHLQRLDQIKRDLGKLVRLHPQSKPLGGHPVWLSGGSAITEASNTFTFLEALQNVNGSGPNQRGKYKSAYMNKAFPRAQINAIYAALTTNVPGADLSQSLLQVDSYGCRVNTVSPNATPIPQRSAVMKLQYQTYWQTPLPPGQSNPAQDELYLSWIRNFYTSVYAPYGGTPNPANDPTNTVAGCYYNYPDVDLGVGPNVGQALQLYFGANYRTNPLNLYSVKQTWDLNNYFSHAQSIA